jgi:deoxyribodipyrimidine photolyase-related protein
MDGRVQPRMEHFYRRMRVRTGWLMEDDQPSGGAWNFDVDNRKTFDARGPGLLPPRPRVAPDTITSEVLALVEDRFGEHPGSLATFDWPVTREQALVALQDFIEQRLVAFGPYQDAMWAGAPDLWHAKLSSSLNLHLLNPREVCEAALFAHAQRRVPLASVEGFLRQILGWREYVRGIYWQRMPDYADSNRLSAEQALPDFYWTGETDMNCLREALGDTLAHGYAHHIQRLMVTGLFAQIFGVRPRLIHEWYLAIYVDAVEWVELPNVIGMSQHADGGYMGSKPYVASGKYIQRMSNYCEGCRFDPALATGENACPFTTLYWNFLDQHADRFRSHPRMHMQINNLARKPDAERAAIREQAAALQQSLSQRG